jgi:pheromone shutdown protein TraB
LPGEPGSGYTSAASIGHVEPEEIFVLGTSHLSERSVIEVEAAIELLRPDAVVVELCRSRSALLYSDEAAADDMRARNPFSLSGEGGLLQSMQRSVALGGWAPLILRVFLARASDRLGAETRVAPGADFRAARRAAERVGASLI